MKPHCLVFKLLKIILNKKIKKNLKKSENSWGSLAVIWAKPLFLRKITEKAPDRSISDGFSIMNPFWNHEIVTFLKIIFKNSANKQ